MQEHMLKEVYYLHMQVVLVAADWLVYKKKDIYHWVVTKPLAARWVLYWVLIFSSVIFGVYGPSYDAAPFIYFQF